MRISLLSKPWLHFVLAGVLLYSAQRFLEEPVIDVIPPPSAEKLAEMRGQWLRTTGRPITDEQLQRLVDSTIDQEILFREAVKREWHLDDPVVRQRLIRDMRFLDPDSTLSDDRLVKQAMQLSLHENDLVVRRRLIQMMELAAFAPVRKTQPEESELQARFSEQSDQFMKPAMLGFKHVFVSQDKHAEPTLRAQELLALLPHDQNALKQSDPFLHGLSFERISARQAERYFGSAFATTVFTMLSENKAAAGRWLGPVSSSYGEHLLWIDSYQAPQPKQFNEVRDVLLADWRREQEQAALRVLLTQLREHYEVGS